MFARSTCHRVTISNKKSQLNRNSTKTNRERFSTGLGKIQQAYTIQLQEDAKPYALSTPHRIPIPLMGAVKEELR